VDRWRERCVKPRQHSEVADPTIILDWLFVEKIEQDTKVEQERIEEGLMYGWTEGCDATFFQESSVETEMMDVEGEVIGGFYEFGSIK
jgi:hypothetical protein